MTRERALRCAWLALRAAVDARDLELAKVFVTALDAAAAGDAGPVPRYDDGCVPTARSSHDVDRVEAVRAFFAANPDASLSSAARELGIPRTTVRRLSVAMSADMARAPLDMAARAGSLSPSSDQKFSSSSETSSPQESSGLELRACGERGRDESGQPGPERVATTAAAADADGWPKRGAELPETFTAEKLAGLELWAVTAGAPKPSDTDARKFLAHVRAKGRPIATPFALDEEFKKWMLREKSGAASLRASGKHVQPSDPSAPWLQEGYGEFEASDREVAEPPAAAAPPPATLEVTQELRDMCTMAGAPVPTATEVAQALANARSKGLRRHDWRAYILEWQCRTRRFEQTERFRRPPVQGGSSAGWGAEFDVIDVKEQPSTVSSASPPAATARRSAPQLPARVLAHIRRLEQGDAPDAEFAKASGEAP